ncbi:MAG TPA: cytochrome c oxidase assembly protein [Candidatus Saccharimonadales bacterium]|nr:cytochrome c oxidase assembly protein [Candidatus Saccharimonadales bacterium]
MTRSLIPRSVALMTAVRHGPVQPRSVLPSSPVVAGTGLFAGARLGLRALLGAGLGAVAWLLAALPVAAHGTVAQPPTDPVQVLLEWSFDPTIQIPLILLAAGYLAAVRHVNAAHLQNPVPWRRVAYFLAGVFAIELALQSPIEYYDTTLFSVHMVQHVLLTLVAAPLLALGAPITLLLRLATHDQRRRWILPVLHSAPVRFLSFPVVAWLVFAGVMWGTHFSPIFNESLENPLIHDLEHVAYLIAGLLFWWPAVGADPSPWRMPHPARLLYVFLQMPQNTFLAVAILAAPAPLYRHYATLNLSWGSGPLADQQLAGGFMWVAGDLIFLTAILAIVASWMHHEERNQARVDAHVDAEMAEIRMRETRLADRLAGERPGES